MREICIDGHFVPAVIAADFYRKEKTPFSYTKDTPGYEKRKSPLRCPKILPFVFEPEVEEMAQPVHLQYNSPLNLYSKESAVEQFEQQIGPGGGAIPLPSNDKQFDPSKSQTLKYLQESEREHFGENFFDKIAQAERARVPVDQEPHWARYAREKSERARSRTPADPSQHHTPAHTPAPSNHPVHHETAREHAEKNKIFTHTTQPIDGRAYWDAKSYNGRRGRSLTRERSYPDRGYELGGLDYTKGLPIEHGAQDFYYESHRSRKEEPSRRPGFEMGGTDFGKGYVAPGPYHGHGPDPPRLRPHYSADSRSTCNAYTAPNIESVDANLLVGDTLSNQKIRHEVRHIDQSEFGTSFCPTTGFRRDHVAVRRSPAPQAETTFSVTAPRSASLGRSSAPADQKDVYWSKQAESEREVYVTEPNWSRNVNQRKNAWERKSYDTEARVNLPPSAKITPAVPPPWHDRAIRTHNIWQSAAQNMDQHHHMHQGSQQQQQHQQSFHSSSHTTSAPAPIPAPAPQQQFGATAANLQINSGYNANQLDYVLGNQDKYGPGQRYNSLNNQINSNITNSSAIPLGSQSFNQNYSSHSQTKTTSQYSPVPQYDRNLSASHHENQQRRSVERIIPVSPVPSAGNFSQSYSTHTSSHFPPTQIGGGANYEGSAMNNYSFLCECRVIPDPIFEARSYEKSTHHEETTTKTPLPPVPVSSLEEQRSLKQMHHEEMRTIPIQPIETRFEEKRYNKTVTQTETTIPVVPIRTSYQESYNKSTKEEETRTTSVPVMQDDYEASNYNKYTHQETTKTQPLSIIPTANENYSYHTEKFSQQSQPSPAASHRSEFSSSRYSKQEKTSTTTTQQQTGGYSNQQRTETQTTNLPITRNTTYNYQQVQQPTIPVTPQISQSSYTSHTEKKESSTTPAAPISSYQYDQHHSHRQESHREETSRPVSQLSQYSEQRNYKKNYEEKTETRTIPAVAPVTSHTSSSSTNKVVNDINEVFDRKAEMNEKLPHGSISNTHNNTEGGYRDIQGHDVEYKRELTTSANPGKEYALLKEEEKRTVETPLEPGVISRHVTTKYYKKKTVTDTTTTTNGVPAQ